MSLTPLFPSYDRSMLEEPLEVLIGNLLRLNNLKLATAESCTGGLVGHLLTNVPGSSDYYLGGVISYANQAKMRLLGVRQETLEKHGAVSEETVLEMARGARQALSADLGLSISGIAGPGGGTPEKPVGLVWIGLSAPGIGEAQRFLFTGDRAAIKEQSAQEALHILAAYLEHLESKR
jgi:PncC family amidohydrolase